MFRDFLRHLFPRFIRSKERRFTYTFCLGGMSFTMFLLLTVTGALLMLYYLPGEEAYRSLLFIEEQVYGGKLIRSVHRMSSHFLLVLLVLHMVRVVLTGAYSVRRYNWVVGCFLLIVVVFCAYTGYLLPGDQLAWWATVTGMELIRQMPGGEHIVQLLAPGGVGSSLTASRFYGLHVFFLPSMILVLSLVHFYRVRKDKGVLPYL